MLFTLILLNRIFQYNFFIEPAKPMISYLIGLKHQKRASMWGWMMYNNGMANKMKTYC